MSNPRRPSPGDSVSRRGFPTEQTLARHGRLRRAHPVAVVAKFIAAALAVLLVSAGGVAAFAVWNVASSARDGVALPGEENVPPEIGTIEGGVNMLLVGSDSGGGNAAYGKRGETLNDVTMLMHISADHTRATVVSFPRDLTVDLPECTGPDGTVYPPVYSVKMNTALARGGLACPVATVREMTGLDIPYAALIEFDGVIAMSNAVGGVPVCVATAIHDRQISFDLDAGAHSLSGRDALQFLRSRYGVGDGSDLTRISNQQQFLSSLVRTLKSSETLSNPVKLYGIATAAVQNLTFSNSLKDRPDTMVAIAGALADIPLDQVVFVRYPGVAVGSGVQQNTEAADTLFAALAADQPIALSGGTGGGTTVEETPSASPSAPAASGDPGASASASGPSASASSGVVELPDSIEGQDASQQTCTKGQTAGG